MVETMGYSENRRSTKELDWEVDPEALTTGKPSRLGTQSRLGSIKDWCTNYGPEPVILLEPVRYI